jgi:hypothetical protein
MKHRDVTRRLRMLDRYGYQCVVCGYEFESLACVTYEHVVPKSRGAEDAKDNVQPSHYSCNRLKGTKSLKNARHAVRSVRGQMNEADFLAWLNMHVPSRDVPDFVLYSPEVVRSMFYLELLEAP